MENNFEKAILKLEQIVEQLESGDLPLEEAINKYKEGLKLTKYCNEELKKAEKVIIETIEES